MSIIRPRLLDLFCGAGGCAVGYHRAGFDVVGIDIAPQKHYPFEFHQADALEYLTTYGHEFDVIHASPPCQRYSVETPRERKNDHPDLIAATRAVLSQSGKPYIIENVAGARALLHNPTMLCGSMFGLRVWRHRYFEICPEFIFLLPSCQHHEIPVLVTGTTRRKGYARVDPPIALRRIAMKIDWMVISELDEAIPPAYTEYIGTQLLAYLNA